MTSTGCAPAEDPPPAYFETPDFALVDQMGDTLRAGDLRGGAWVAGFIFTNCDAVCPLITTRMATLRDSLAEAGLLGDDVRLVSITVDPARDTPEVLRAYAATYGASPSEEWAFLTGSPPTEVRRLVEEGFKVTAMLPPGVDARSDDVVTHADHGADRHSPVAGAAENYQVTHSPRLLLVDREGWVRGAYTATEPEVISELLADLRPLLR